MNSAKKFLDFYINSSIHVALAVVALAWITNVNLKVPVDKSLMAFIFFGTVTAYNFVKYAGLAKLYHRSLAKGLRIIQIFSFFTFLGLLISVFYISTRVLLWAGFFGLITLLYALPVFSRRRNLRSISGLKIFIIALVCSGVTVLLPVTGAKNVIFQPVVIEFVQRFLLVLVLILPFEIRDLKYDLEQLGTIPQRVGITATKIIGLIILIVVLGLEIPKVISTPESKLGLLATVLITAVVVWKSKENQSRYFAAFWVEGIPMLWLLLLLLFRNL